MSIIELTVLSRKTVQQCYIQSHFTLLSYKTYYAARFSMFLTCFSAVLQSLVLGWAPRCDSMYMDEVEVSS